MGNSYAHVALNLRRFPLSRSPCGKAVAHAIDRRAIAEDVLDGA
jgi:hypothetical protein